MLDDADGIELNYVSFNYLFVYESIDHHRLSGILNDDDDKKHFRLSSIVYRLNTNTKPSYPLSLHNYAADLKHGPAQKAKSGSQRTTVHPHTPSSRIAITRMMQMMGNHSPCVSNGFDRKGRDVSPQVSPLRPIPIIRKMVLIVMGIP